MLKPAEFLAGTINDAPPLSLVLPVGTYGMSFLIGRVGVKRFGVCLTKQYMWSGFESEGNAHHSGLIIPDITVELDETSITSSSIHHSAPGILVRHETMLSVAAQQDGRFGHHTTLVTLMDDLPNSPTPLGFRKWQIAVGEAREKRVLFSAGSDEEA